MRAAVHIKSEKDFWAGAAFVVAGLGFAWGADGFRFGALAPPGPGLLPLGLALALALVGALVIFKSLVVEAEGGGRIAALAWRPLGAVVAALALFGAALPRTGLVPALALLVLVASLGTDRFRLRGAILAAAVLTLAAWAGLVGLPRLGLPLWPAPGPAG
jgi:hypothetical protein